MRRSILKSVTIKKHHQEWLDEHPEIGLSQIVQVGIERQREIFEAGMQHKENKLLRERIEKIMQVLERQREFIEERGLLNEFLEKEERQVVR